MSTQKINDTETQQIEIYSDSQRSKLVLSTKLGLYTLINGKKWFIYVFIAILPLMISWIPRDYLFGNETAEEAFIDVYVGFFYIFMFTFGTLLISLPVSSDEITDNVIDLYLVRPIRRDIFWTSRWITVNVGVFIINTGIVTFYWLYFNAVDKGLTGFLEGFLQIIFYDKGANHIGWNSYWDMIFLVVFATFVYSGLFLLVGLTGERGFTIGMMLALFETFFINLLFLDGSEYIPRTHLNTLVFDRFDSKLDLNEIQTDFSTTYAYTYLLVFGAIAYFLGMWMFKRKEFN